MNEDFCLYARIPIQQMVYIRLYLNQLHHIDYSCTYLFLIRNMRILFYFCKDMNDDHLMNMNDQLNTTKLDECKFEKKLVYILIFKIQ
jgi:hypothetical protein